MFFATYDPFRDLASVKSGLEYDVLRSDEGVVLSIDIPGIDPSTVDLTVEGRSLTLSASRPNPFPEGVQLVSRRSRSGAISQTFQLSERLDADKLSADYNFGVLTVTIPVAESAKPRRVAVAVGAAAAIVTTSDTTEVA